MSNGRVLSEEELNNLQQYQDFWVGTEREHEDIRNLLATIRDRDKTIAQQGEEIERLRQIVEAAEEITVDAGFRERTVEVNREAYERFAQSLIDNGWWSAKDIEAEMQAEEESE